MADSDRIRVGELYEDCSFHPVLCVYSDYDDDELRGVSLIDGRGPSSCSPRHCGVVRVTIEDVLKAKEDPDAYLARRQAEWNIDRHSDS
jgi:hypothetical protein